MPSLSDSSRSSVMPSIFFFDQLGDLLDQTRLVQLVRQLGDDDLLAATDLVDVFDLERARM
jgi:hypothetical protein